MDLSESNDKIDRVKKSSYKLFNSNKKNCGGRYQSGVIGVYGARDEGFTKKIASGRHKG